MPWYKFLVIQPSTSVIAPTQATPTQPQRSRPLTQTRCRSHHGVESGRDAVGAGPAPVPEDDPVVVVVRHLLHGDPDDAPGDGSHRHAGDEEA